MPGMVLLLSALLVLCGLPASASLPLVAANGRERPRAARLPADGGFRWPVDGALVVRRFDPPPQPWLPGHRGVDLGAEPGAVIRAAGAGTIVFAGPVAGRGVVSIAHPGGLRTTYEPVPAGDLQPGDPVTAGQDIGRLAPGHPGCPRVACLHWGLRRGGDYLDPLTLLGLGRVRLLPL